MATTMTNKEAYDGLIKANAHWGRSDDHTIYVWTPGYVTADAHAVEKYLMQAGMRCMSHEFDKVCGKTCSTFKHK